MPNTKKVLVTGASGQQGGSVINALLKRGHNVRGLTRNLGSDAAEALRARGVEIVKGNFNDHDSLVRAATGVDAVFAMSTPFENGVDVETKQGITLTNAIAEAGSPHLVFSSVASADKATGIPHFDSKYDVEQHLLSTGLNTTIIAPVYFMENATSPWFLPALKEGKLSLALKGTTPLQQVAVEDVGAFAASIIERGEAVYGKRYDIAGDSLTGLEAAEFLTEASGHDIRYEGFPADALRPDNEDFALMFEWFENVGYSTDIDSLREDFPEVGWHDYPSWVKKQDWCVLSTILSECA